MRYEIYLLNDYNTPEGYTLAVIPFSESDKRNALFRAYDIAEYLARRMFGDNCELREIRDQLYPMYFADKETGLTISIR